MSVNVMKKPRLRIRQFGPGLLLAALLGTAGVSPAAAQADDTDAGANAAPPPGFWERDTLTGDWGGARTALVDAGITLGLLDQSELWRNLAGGAHRGAVFDGLTTASVTLDLDKLVSWSGAKIYVDGFQIHGRGPTANLVGNLQVVSNVEATDSTKLYDLWFEQKLLGDRLSVRVGQEGANDEMMITQYGALFLNSSFGFPGLAAADLPSGGPNYPMATPFARLSVEATDALSVTAAVYNGDPAPPGLGDPQLRDKNGTAFRLNGQVMAFAEIAYALDHGADAPGLPGTYKLGTWYSTAEFVPSPSGHAPQAALYGIVDQMIWRKPDTKDQGVGVFFQIMGAPEDRNGSRLFVEGGFNWKGPFDDRDSDVIGLGVAYLDTGAAKSGAVGAPFSKSSETALELTYLFQATPWWALQPDAQYVINPGAGLTNASGTLPLKNAFVIGLRSSVTF